MSPDLEKRLVRSSSFEEDSKLSESSCAVSTTKPTYSEESNHKTSDADSIANVFEDLYKSVFQDSFHEIENGTLLLSSVCAISHMTKSGKVYCIPNFS